MRGASQQGLQLTGSGAESVLTGALFRPRQWVIVRGTASTTQTVQADEDGRIAFGVDLGPAHTLEEYTAAEQAAAAANPGYFVTRDVGFTPLPDPHE